MSPGGVHVLNPFREVFPIERPGCDPPRGPLPAHRRGQRLVPRRFEGRGAGPYGIRPHFRARDVRGFEAPQPQLLRAAAEGGRGAERLNGPRPYQLLGERPFQLPRARAVARIGPDGLPARRPGPEEVRHPAGRRQERATAELREPPLRLQLPAAATGALPPTPSL